MGHLVSLRAKTAGVGDADVVGRNVPVSATVGEEVVVGVNVTVGEAEGCAVNDPPPQPQHISSEVKSLSSKLPHQSV